MVLAIYFHEDVFRFRIEPLERGVHGCMVGEAFELFDLGLQVITPRLRTIHGIDFSHDVSSRFDSFVPPFEQVGS